MAEIINLRTERKRAKRRRAEQEAAVRRLEHGQSKAKRDFDKSQSEGAARRLDEHRIETGDGQ